MIVLSAIGRFFKKIWDWIKQTAWIQPLLIVGVIFGVIFSIPSIVKGVKAANEKKNAADVYYMQHQLSLEGGANSDADNLTKAIYAENGKPLSDGKTKFFLMYVSSSNSESSGLKRAFQILEEKMSGSEGSEFRSEDGKPFKLVTIFTDQKTSATTTKKTAFEQYLDRNSSFFEQAGGAAFDTDYYENGKLSESSLNFLIDAEKSTFPSPTIMLVDTNPVEKYTKRGYEAGVNEIMFGVDGSDDYDKAVTLLDCWNHANDFDRD